MSSTKQFSSRPKIPQFGPSITPSVPQVAPSVPQVGPSVPQVSQAVKSGTKSLITKWLPFIAAGTAVGVSVLALKELRKIKNEMVLVKNQQSSSPKGYDPDISKKMESFEIQLKKINEFLMNNNSKNPKIIKSMLKSQVPDQPTIINEPDDDIEYEEVEVTDDEESGDETN